MKIISILRLTTASFLITAFGSAIAQDTLDDQADVWAVVEEQWDADEKGDKKWIDRLLADDFSGWGKNSPAPRSKASTKMWDRFNNEHNKSLMHELYPLAIVVHENIAIAHYLYTNATENKKDEIDVSSGRYSDVLIRTDDGWKFLAWHGGDDASND
jgi:hypothetical protein